MSSNWIKAELVKRELSNTGGKQKEALSFSQSTGPQNYNINLRKLLEIKSDSGADPPSWSINMVKIIQTFDVVYT